MASRKADIHRVLRLRIASIHALMREIEDVWAASMKITTPQWTILQAISMLDLHERPTIKDVANTLRVHASFITTQSKILEDSGLLSRSASKLDRRIVHLSLTDGAHKSLARLSSRIQALDEFIFSGIADKQFEVFADLLAAVQTRLKKAAMKAIIDD